jgi:TPR repeat protein
LYEAGEGGAIRDQGTAREWYRLAAEQGVAEAAYQVGRFSPGREQRIAWYARAADQGHAEAAYQLYRLLEPTDPTAALSRLRSAAGRQHAGAQFLLGQLHRTGAGGTDKDLRRTRELWSRAAKAGDMSAMRALAVAYARGGVLFDHAPALSLHWEQEARKLAASRPPTAVGEQALALNWERELDEVRARHNLADSGDAAALLAIGREILAEADAASGLLDKALGWLERAAVTGSVEAQYLLASRCLGVAPGQEASCAQAQRWLIAAADAGHEQALRKVIAGFKKPAYGLPRDLQRSRAYSEALFNLLDARGTPANHSDGLAASWEYVDTLKQLEKETRGHLPADELQERSDAGDPAAQYQLAREWLGSRFADAVALMSLSAHAGYPQAQYEMARRYRDGKRTPEEERQAIAWLTAAAASGHRGAMVDLGVVYLQGIARIGLERDPYRAKALLAQALEDRDHVVYAQDTGDGRSWRYTVTQVHRWLAQIPDSLAPEDPGVLEEDAQVRRAVEP